VDQIAFIAQHSVCGSIEFQQKEIRASAKFTIFSSFDSVRNFIESLSLRPSAVLGYFVFDKIHYRNEMDENILRCARGGKPPLAYSG
jgi:hypothetical protein